MPRRLALVAALPQFRSSGSVAAPSIVNMVTRPVDWRLPGPPGAEPVWARDGRRIFYRDGRHLVAASITTAPAFAVTGRTGLFADDYVFAQAPHANYDVSLDGSRFLMVKGTQTPHLVVVYGWLSEPGVRMWSAGVR